MIEPAIQYNGVMQHSIRTRLLSGTAWALAGKIISLILGLLVSALLARLLTKDDMGAYFLALSLVSIVAIIGQLGLPQILVRFIAEATACDDYQQARQVVLISFRNAGIASFTLCAATWLFGSTPLTTLLKSRTLETVLGAVAIWILVSVFQSLVSETFRGYHDIRFASLFGGLLASLVSFVMLSSIWFFIGHAELGEVIWIVIAGATFSLLIASFTIGKRLNINVTRNVNARAIQSKEVMQAAWPLWVTGITLFFITQADIWVLAFFKPTSEVATYAAASRLVALVSMSLIVVNAVIPPMISELYSQKNKTELEKLLRTTATVAGIPATLVLVLLMLNSEAIIRLVYGDKYQAGGIVMIILGVGQLVNVWAGSCGMVLMMTGHQKSMMVITIACGAITVIGALLLVVPYGAVGVATSAALGMTLQNLMQLIEAKRKTGVWSHLGLIRLQPIIDLMKPPNM
ncbi:flippase [Sinimarinibacterium sp. CAU 1509]|uniref:flippase n=1 Tax=Sinimarinibacterium sp. CAU 1509 TaxID=2562283 RepID=UPI0010ABF62F|nr:flippase [Sinimarinibacterium sp. CAU 1509]TJY61951.1 flippase [Sinimarinibacterium sp. CAU 1509]